MAEASRKIEGGKFVKVKIEGSQVEILGDFFIYPEESIEGVEKVVESDIKANVEVEDIAENIRRYLDEHDVEMIGFSPNDIAELVEEARR